VDSGLLNGICVDGEREARGTASGGAACRIPGLPRGDFFSLGGVLAAYLKTDSILAPWTLSSALLVVLACWDPLTRGGGVDTILLGLAAYELLIALTRPPDQSAVPRRAWAPAPSASTRLSRNQ
jgi:hypothetical protein